MALKQKNIGISADFMKANMSNRTSAPESPMGSADPFNLPKTSARKSARNTRPCKVYSFIDNDTKEKLDLIKVKNKLDGQDFICAAIKEFLQRHVDTDMLITEEGRGVIKKLLQ